MSLNRNLRPISTTQERATQRPSHYEVAEALRGIGRSAAFSPCQIEVDEPIHLCFQSYRIELVRQIVRWALDNPDTWLESHPKQLSLTKKVEALQVRMGVHPGFPQSLLRDRYEAFGAAVGKSGRTIRDHAAHMIEALARILVDSPGRLAEEFLEQPRSMVASGLVTMHSVVNWRALSSVDVGVYYPVAAPHITTNFEVELPADGAWAVKSKTESLQEVKVQDSQAHRARRREFEGTHLEPGSSLELSLRRAQAGVAISSGSATKSRPAIFGIFGTGLDLYQSLYFQEGGPPIECYSVEVQALPDGRWRVRQLQSENEELEELARVAKTWKRSRPDTYYGFFVLWETRPIPPVSTYISKYFDRLRPDFRLQIMQSDNAQEAIA